ncbi:MAG: hypothetical protein KAH95_03760 [Spirochaetales bacterium]|nr:hypothetical protein [Spirochaetales bacterium]
MLKKSIFLFFLIITVVFVSGEEIGNLSISLTPGGVLPLGDSTSYFTVGGGAGLSADLRLNSLPLLFFKLDTAYSSFPSVQKTLFLSIRQLPAGVLVLTL